MKNFIKVALVAGLCLMSVTPAMALFEVRGGLGLNLGDPDSGSITIEGEDFPTVPAAFNLTADALITLPLVPVGFGLRYERMGLSASDEIKFDLLMTRTSAVVNYRIIDTLIYLGPIATVGLAHSNSLKISNIPGVSNRTYSSDMDAFSTYTVGLEAGAGLLGLSIGAEVGYMAMNMKNPKTSGGTALGGDLNFTGGYVKVMAGFGF